MPDDGEVWQALLRRKGLTVVELAKQLGVTRQHVHRLLTARRSADSRRDELDRALALGPSGKGRPLYAIAELVDGQVELVPAGEVQPLFADRDQAQAVADGLKSVAGSVCAVPIWPAHAWQNLVAFHAAWGMAAEPRSLFIVDEVSSEVPLEPVVWEIRSALEATLRLRARARDPALLGEVEGRLQRLH